MEPLPAFVERRHLSPPRAIICDIYGTLLDIAPAPPDAEARWRAIQRGLAGPAPKPLVPLAEFESRTRAEIMRSHADSRARGIRHPEVDWFAIARAALPAWRSLPDAILAELIARHSNLVQPTRLMPGAATAIRILTSRGIRLGLASNAQAVTLAQLEAALTSEALSASLFDPTISFLSYAHGFAKPDPEVFRFIDRRLHPDGIRPHEILMIGDRIDNDLLPAEAIGWCTWHFSARPAAGRRGGTWTDLVATLACDGPAYGA